MNYRRFVEKYGKEINLAMLDEGDCDLVIKNAPAYLTVARALRWDGSDGYKIDHEKDHVFMRSYDATITPVEASSGGKVLHTIESSHDVPTGADTYVIALTKRESWCINGLLMQTDFESIDEFVEKNIEKSLGRKKEKEEER